MGKLSSLISDHCRQNVGFQTCIKMQSIYNKKTKKRCPVLYFLGKMSLLDYLIPAAAFFQRDDWTSRCAASMSSWPQSLFLSVPQISHLRLPKLRAASFTQSWARRRSPCRRSPGRWARPTVLLSPSSTSSSCSGTRLWPGGDSRVDDIEYKGKLRACSWFWWRITDKWTQGTEKLHEERANLTSLFPGVLLGKGCGLICNNQGI